MVCHKKLLEIRNLLPEHSTGVGVTYQLSAVGMADDDTVGVDINLTLNCCFGGFERLQGRKDQTVGVIGQRVSGNTGLFLVGLGKPPSMTRILPPHLTGLSPFLERTGT